MCKRVEGRQQTGMRGGGGGGGGGGGAAAALVRRLSLVAGGRQKQTGGQPSEAAASEAGLEGSEHKVFHIKRDSFFSLRAVQTLQVGTSRPFQYLFHLAQLARQQLCIVYFC